ncbi:hypothetical protein TNCV_2673521 [Trichonephila clavipes]|nr:hypothetical protein TNCV_2673521 [Trichonephila clavipes]
MSSISFDSPLLPECLTTTSSSSNRPRKSFSVIPKLHHRLPNRVESSPTWVLSAVQFTREIYLPPVTRYRQIGRTCSRCQTLRMGQIIVRDR